MGRVLGALALAVAIPILAGGAGACGKKRQRRSFDAAPVELVQTPVVADAGAGAAHDELEPNDGDDVATPLAVGATARGRIDPDADVDHYRIEVTEPGELAIELSGVEGVDLVLELEDAADAVIARSDRGAARIREGLPNVGVTPGRYTAVVRAKKRPPPRKPRRTRGKVAPPDAGVAPGPAPAYELTVRMAPSVTGAEREPDDDRGTSSELIVGDTATGFVGWAGDADVWKLSVETLSENNAIDVEVSAVEGVGLAVEVVDGVGQVLATRKAPRGAPLALRGLLPVVPPGAPPFHYLTIRGDRSNPEIPYQLRVVGKVPGPDAEIEPNDAPDRAMAVPADRMVVRATWTPGDVDCFVLAADEVARTIEVTVDTPPDTDLSAELLVDGKVIASGAHPGKGAAERVAGPVPVGAQPVIRIRGTDGSGEGAYALQIREGPAPAP